MAWLTDEEREVLGLVLEPRPDLTRKGNPGLRDLSLYSSELKGLKQIAGELAKIQAGTFESQEDRTRTRYFRTLAIHGLVTGTPETPVLTSESAIFFEVAAKDDGSTDYWQRNRDLVEGPLVQAMAEKLASNREGAVAEQARRVFWNTQLFFDLVPEAEISATLSDLDLLKILQFVNSVGMEPARYYRLSETERIAFRAAFNKVLSTGATAVPVPGEQIEERAKLYYSAAKSVQADVRFRVAAYLTAFLAARSAMGSRFPRLSQTLKVTGVSQGSTNRTTKIAGAPTMGSLQVIVSGCPGSGKSFWLDTRLNQLGAEVVRTQFHAETSYFDFIGSYKPVPVYESLTAGVTITAANGTLISRGRPLISYQFVPGPLVEALVVALRHPDEPVVLVIEELNRGNCAAIFGDVFQLLDRASDGYSRYGITPSQDLQAYLAEAGVLKSGHPLRLPANLYLWATMNSADQGVFPLDTAFRRRWDFVYRGHGEVCAYPTEARRIVYGGRVHDWDDFRGALNAKLRGLKVHEDKLIGPYFLSVEQLASPDAILNKLFLYLWDDVQRFHQDELFVAGSFAEVGATWAEGHGSPLLLELAPGSALDHPANDDETTIDGQQPSDAIESAGSGPA